MTSCRKPFASKVSRVYDVNDRCIYWSNQGGVADMAAYQEAFLAAFRENHDDGACTAATPLDCIRALHMPFRETRPCFPDGLFVLPCGSSVACQDMPWFDAVIFVATGRDVGRVMARVKRRNCMDVFHIPVSERPPFGPCNNLQQQALQPAFHATTSENKGVPEGLSIKALVDAITGSVCVACMAGSNRSTSALVLYGLLSSNLSLAALLDHFGKIRKFQIFDYNISQLIAAEALRDAYMQIDTSRVDFQLAA